VNVDFPFHVDARRRTAVTGPDDHVRDLIEQLVFTSPGERLNRPAFGAGLRQLVFAPSSPELAAALQFLVEASLQQYLADLITVAAVTVDSIDTQLVVDIAYVLTSSQQQASVRFEVAT
jgi:phage baseplate assembly protein W